MTYSKAKPTTKEELKQALIELGTEYLYQDVGYGGFYNGNFIVQGKIVNPTKQEFQEMYNTELSYL